MLVCDLPLLVTGMLTAATLPSARHTAAARCPLSERRRARVPSLAHCHLCRRGSERPRERDVWDTRDSKISAHLNAEGALKPSAFLYVPGECVSTGRG